MTRTTGRLAVLAAAAGTVVAVRGLRTIRRRGGWATPDDGDGGDRWHTVTVALPIDEVSPAGRPPRPLADLGTDVEVRIRPAPGDRGTEVAARSRDGGRDATRAVRRALRETRSRLETGEVLRPDAPPTTERTLFNRPLAHATRHGREEGTL